ncbi:MAG: glycosyltransferase [Acidobacteria bacterium]|nr:MAG: glycosyltransferase [Acidobacteriota bacterium]
MVQGNGDPGRLVRLILASLHDLLGLAGGDLDHHRRAVELDPEFPFFRWNLAAALLRRGEPDDLDEAQRLLEDLARNTVLLRPATRELEALAGRGRVVRPLEGLKSRCERAPKGGIGATLDLEGRCADLPDLPRVAAKLPPAAPPFGPPAAPASVETLVVPEGHERIDYAVTAVVSVWRSRRFIEGLLDDLLSQSLGPRLEIVVVDSASPEGEGRIVLDRLRRHPNIVYLRTDRRETSHAAFSRAAALARAPYLALANTDDRHHPEALERLARVLDARPDVGLVYADFWVTVRENARFDEAPFEKLKRLEEFTLFDLLAHCSVGPQPMWRKELHHRHGLFDATLDVAGDWEMWLRFAREDVFLHVPETLGVYYYSPTSCERRDPRRAKRENEHILRAYDPLWAEQNARRREARIAAPRLDEILALIVRGDDPGRAAASVAELRKERPRRRDVRFAVVRADEGIPDVPGGPPADPPSWTLPEVMSDGWPWRYRAVALMPAGARLTARRLEELAERLFAGERTGALRVREGAGEVVLLSSSAVLDAASLLAAPERPDAWLDAVARRGWNVAVCAGAETGNA